MPEYDSKDGEWVSAGKKAPLPNPVIKEEPKVEAPVVEEKKEEPVEVPAEKPVEPVTEDKPKEEAQPQEK